MIIFCRSSVNPVYTGVYEKQYFGLDTVLSYKFLSCVNFQHILWQMCLAYIKDW